MKDLCYAVTAKYGSSRSLKTVNGGCGQKPGLISQEVVHAFLRGTNEGSPTVHQV